MTFATSSRPSHRRIVLSRLALIGTVIVALPAGVVHAQQDYPNKPIKLIVPYAAGGSVDAIGRTLAQELTTRLGQSVVVENRVGAGSNVGSAFVAKSPPDGYTLLITSPGNAINVTLFKTMPYDVKTELTQVAVVGRAPGILAVAPSFPASNVKEFVAMAKQAPGTLNFGSGGRGSSEHLSGEMFKTTAGIDLVHVPYKGGSSVVTDLIGGRVQAFFTNQANVVGQIKGNAIKVLGVASNQRSLVVPRGALLVSLDHDVQMVTLEGN